MPLSKFTTDDDTEAIVRRCLRKLTTGMQQSGEIPPDVPDAELDLEIESHVLSIVVAARRNAMYHSWKDAGHLEEHIQALAVLSLKLDHPKTNLDLRFGNHEDELDRDAGRVYWLQHAHETALAADQISYVDSKTGRGLTPTWKHRNCGGTVYPANDSSFHCSSCKREGQLGAEMPDSLSRPEQMKYMLMQVEEVDLT